MQMERCLLTGARKSNWSYSMRKEEWLKLPYLVRAWRVLFCKHPWKEGTRIHEFTIDHLKPKDPDFDYVVSVYECGKCGKHFIMEGLELNARGKRKWDIALGKRSR